MQKSYSDTMSNHINSGGHVQLDHIAIRDLGMVYVDVIIQCTMQCVEGIV